MESLICGYAGSETYTGMPRPAARRLDRPSDVLLPDAGVVGRREVAAGPPVEGPAGFR